MWFPLNGKHCDGHQRSFIALKLLNQPNGPKEENQW